MLDSSYHMTLNNFCYRVFGLKTSRFWHKYAMLFRALKHFYHDVRQVAGRIIEAYYLFFTAVELLLTS